MNIVNFKNHILISMPNLYNSFFYRTIIYIYQDDDVKINGVIINKQINNLTIKEFFNKLKIHSLKKNFLKKINVPIMFGGPVKQNKGLIVHSLKKNFLSDIYVSKSISITSSKDILENLKKKNYFKKMLIVLGHCSWHKKQLKKEILRNNWLIITASKKILFHTSIEKKWEKCIKLLGIKNFHTITIENGKI
jgi:putative transcriptional regulator